MDLELSPKNIGWLAGIFEGEGYFGITTRGSRQKKAGSQIRNCVVLSVTMTDLDVMQRISEMCKTPLSGPYLAKKSTKPFWTIKLTGKKAIEWAMTVYLFMSNRRQERIQEMISYWKDSPTKGKPSRT